MIINSRRSAIIELFFERNGTFINGNTELQDCSEFLTSSQARYTPITTSTTIELVSTATTDSTSGTGARTVRLEYLDSNGLRATRIETMNGTTPINLGSGYSAINGLSTVTVGSNSVVTGDITVRSVADTSIVYAGIKSAAPSGNKSQIGITTIPRGYVGYMTMGQVTSLNNSAEVKIRATNAPFTNEFNEAYLFKWSAVVPINATVPINMPGILVLPGQSVKVSAAPIGAITGNTRVFGTLYIELYKD